MVIKKDATVSAMESVIDMKMKALDAILKEHIEPLGKLGSPEKVIGKKYEDWTPEDIQMMAKLPKTQFTQQVEDLIFKKEYAKTKQLDKETM